MRELSVLKNLKESQQQNIVGFVGAYNELADGDGPNALYIFTEYCQGGDLLGLLLNHSIQLGWKFRVNLAYQAACAMHYLHENNIIHRDIKSEVCLLVHPVFIPMLNSCSNFHFQQQNFLLGYNWTCKLTDFGFSRTVSDPSTPSRSV